MSPENTEQNAQSVTELENSSNPPKKTWTKPVIENIVSVDRTEMGFFGAIHLEDGIYSGS